MVLKDTKNVDYNPERDYEDNLKYKTIKEINEAGLDIIYIIQKYGLSERDAFLIESVLIESYSVDIKLTNKIKGFDATEPENAITLQRDLCAEEYKDSKENPKYMIIKVKQYWLDQRVNRYETTKSSWKLNIATATKYPYVLSVTNGIVRAVYKVNEWHYIDDSSGRAEFIGVEAEKEVADIFLNERIPAKYRKRGQASPCLYCKHDDD